MLCVYEAYSAADGPEGDHPLNAVGVAATVGLKAGVVSLLQDKLLAAEAGVLIAHPAVSRKFKIKPSDNGTETEVALWSFLKQLLSILMCGEDLWILTRRTRPSGSGCCPSRTP